MAAEGVEWYDTAIRRFSDAIRLGPRSSDAYINRGVAYVEKGECDAAIADYTEAIRLDPSDPFVFSSRGIVYMRKGQ